MAEDKLRYYLDEHVDVEIARQLNRLGIDTITVQTLKTQGEDDPIQLQMATDLGRVLCTMDSDYVDLAGEGTKRAGIVFIPSEHSEIGVVARYLDLMARVFTADEARNHVEYVCRLD
ncbi:MAG: DUF5615 family PIN-like protein [Chloroflexota bacterium]|nr:DUF5615 family PIN-like protein [Chloroflexota bacterium]MDE2908833.1 DUF5615 family PIN-like protein [Chloroflexota bacterium]